MLSKVNSLNELLGNLLSEFPDLLAVLVVDLDGLIIAQQSVSGFDEELIGAIMGVLEQTINKIKRYTETSYGSGTFDTNEFQLFYVELGKLSSALFVLVTDPYSDLQRLLPYSYIVAEKVTLILNNISTSTNIPKLKGINGSDEDEDNNEDKKNGFIIITRMEFH